MRRMLKFAKILAFLREGVNCWRRLKTMSCKTVGSPFLSETIVWHGDISISMIVGKQKMPSFSAEHRKKKKWKVQLSVS